LDISAMADRISGVSSSALFTDNPSGPHEMTSPIFEKAIAASSAQRSLDFQ
jgi:hypothetical protein